MFINKTSRSISSLAIFACLISACGSTPKKTERYTIIEPITVNSTEEITWDTDKSTALNYARMGLKSELGYGLRDKARPLEGVQSKSTNKVLSFVTGFLAMDIGTGVAMVANESARDSKIHFSPYAIDFVPVSEIDINNSIETSRYLMARLDKQIKNSLESGIVDGKYVGTYSDNNPLGLFTYRTLMDGKVCREATDYLMPETKKGTMLQNHAMNQLIGLGDEYLSYKNLCTFNVGTSISGILSGHYVVVHQLAGSNLSYYLGKVFAENSGLAFIFPEVFHFYNASTNERYYFEFPYSYVVKDGEKYLFDSAETSISPIAN